MAASSQRPTANGQRPTANGENTPAADETGSTKARTLGGILGGLPSKVIATVAGAVVLLGFASYLHHWCSHPCAFAHLSVCSAAPGNLFGCCEGTMHIAVDSKEIPGNLRWVAYSPTHYDPNAQVFPSQQTLKDDLRLLHEFGFDGVVTYSSQGVLASVPAIAEQVGFQGAIVGVWDPGDCHELENATRTAAETRIVRGFVVGNEGLYPMDGTRPRYGQGVLAQAMQLLRRETGKPVTTSEDSSAYEKDAWLRAAGDWVFPNAHAFWKGYKDPRRAVAWTRQFFQQSSQPRGLPVVLKEVGLPTVGTGQDSASEASQKRFFFDLKCLGQGPEAGSPVDFVWFEAFDQPWKTGAVEGSWGLFRADRSPKEAARAVRKPCSIATVAAAEPTHPSSGPTAPALPPTSSVAVPGEVIYVYRDNHSPQNRFSPNGIMGDTSDLSINSANAEGPVGGTGTSVRLTYRPRDSNGMCAAGGYPGPCKWAGLYWQYPPGNFGQLRQGWDLTGFRTLKFWARSPAPVRVKFLVGGIAGDYPDSIVLPIEETIDIGPQWQEHSIDLVGADLSHVVGGFGFTINWPDNGIVTADGQELIFDVDDIRFER